jgi:hypothetical protein
MTSILFQCIRFGNFFPLHPNVVIKILAKSKKYKNQTIEIMTGVWYCWMALRSLTKPDTAIMWTQFKAICKDGYQFSSSISTEILLRSCSDWCPAIKNISHLNFFLFFYLLWIKKILCIFECVINDFYHRFFNVHLWNKFLIYKSNFSDFLKMLKRKLMTVFSTLSTFKLKIIFLQKLHLKLNRS